jgi:hypothetical protein
MPTKKQQVVSAQVILRSASGKSPGGQTAITAENISDYLPSAETAARAREAFAAAGFQTGPVVGTSFSITAPIETFEKMFNTRLRLEKSGAIKSVKTESGAYEISLRGLPKTLVDQVESVTFTPPPEFGPTSF